MQRPPRLELLLNLINEMLSIDTMSRLVVLKISVDAHGCFALDLLVVQLNEIITDFTQLLDFLYRDDTFGVDASVFLVIVFRVSVEIDYKYDDVNEVANDKNNWTCHDKKHSDTK